MDIKTWILIGGGLLLLAVIGHGFWLAWRTRRAGLRVDIDRNIPREEIDPLELLRGELPNGGARVRGEEAPRTQDRIAFPDEPAAVGVEGAGRGPAVKGRRVAPSAPSRSAAPSQRADAAPEAPVADADDAAGSAPARTAPGGLTTDARDRIVSRSTGAHGTHAGQRARAPTTNVSAEPPVTVAEPLAPERDAHRFEPPQAPSGTGSQHVAAPRTERRATEVETGRAVQGGRGRTDMPKAAVNAAESAKPDPRAPRPPAEPDEVIVINVLARHRERFTGTGLMEVLLRNSLKFGDMNIFHRVEPITKSPQFSIASAVEPGTFDLSAMDRFETRGVCLFMRLPGPSQPLATFEDMLSVARDIASALGGDLKDEEFNVMTAQNIEHCRQRITEHTRRRLSHRS